MCLQGRTWNLLQSITLFHTRLKMMVVWSVWSSFCSFVDSKRLENGFNDHLDLKKLLWPMSKTQCQALHQDLTFLPLPNSHWSGHKNPRQEDKVLFKVKVQTQHSNLITPVFFYFSAFTLLSTLLQLPFLY